MPNTTSTTDAVQDEPIAIYRGPIVHGQGRGKTVGMPTANLEMRQHEITVPPGVYASRITVKGALHLSLTNIGTRPTVDDLPHLTVETHILDFDQDIYGEEVTLEIYRFLRCVQKFSVLDQVKEQVQRDILETRRYFGLGLPGAG